MKSWPVHDAKALFSELLETCLKEGPQLVTKLGEDAAVLVPISRLAEVAARSQPHAERAAAVRQRRGELNTPKRAAFRSWRRS